MLSKNFVISNAQGLHMRPAGTLAAEMGKMSCNVSIKFNGNIINAKSLMNIIAACIKCGSKIEVVCDGADEQAAMDKITEMIESGFGE